MGCCTLKDRTVTTALSLLRAVRMNDGARVRKLLQACGERLDVNAPIKQKNGKSISPLTLAVLRGRTEAFVELIERGKAKLYVTEQQLRAQGQTVLGIICERGYIQLLEYYFPKFVEGKYLKPQRTWAEDELCAEPLIQTASRYGQVEIIRYFKEVFKYRDTPTDFSIHWINDTTGCNCALLSVSSGKLEAVQYLHHECGADFLLKTKSGDSALSLAVKSKAPLALVKFLVEEVKVPVETEIVTPAISHELGSYLEVYRATHEQSENGCWDWNAISPIVRSEDHSECLDILALYTPSN